MLVWGSKRELAYALGFMYRKTHNFLHYMLGKAVFCREGKSKIVHFENLWFLDLSPRWKKPDRIIYNVDGFCESWAQKK